MDTATLSALRALAGGAAGLPPELHPRLCGESIDELSKDAAAMAVQFGFRAPPADRTRDQSGRFTSFNDQIRRSTGRQVSEPGPPQDGDVGIGLGSAAVPKLKPPASMSARMRAAASVRRHAIEDLAPSFEP